MDSSHFEDTPGRPQPWGAGPQPEPPPEPAPPPAREPVFNAPWPAVAIAALVVGGYGVQSLLPETVVAPLVFAPADLTTGRWWTVVTAIFLHGSWTHAFMNGAFALAFGTPAARLFGDRAAGVACFFGFYVLTGVLANLGYAALHLGSVGGLVGASGSVSGLMGAAARLIAGRGGLGPIFSRSALSFGAALFAVNLLVAFFGDALTPMTGGAGIAWEAHIVGFLAGLMLIGPFARLAWRN